MKFHTIISLSILVEYTSASVNLNREINRQRRADHGGGQSYHFLDETEDYDDPQEQLPQYAYNDPHLERIYGQGDTDQQGESSTSNQAAIGSSAENVYHTTWPGYATTAVFVGEGGDTVHLIVGNNAPNIRRAWQEGKGERLSISFAKVQNNIDSGQTGRWKNSGFKIMQGFKADVSYLESLKYLPQARNAKRLAESQDKKLQVVWKDHGKSYGKVVDPGKMPSRRKRNLISKGIAARSSGPETFVKPVMLKDYTLMNKSGIARLGQMATLIDVSSAAVARKRAASINIIQQLSTPIQDSSQDSTTGATTQFLETFAAFQTVQANISNTIFPILFDMTSKTNSSLIFQAALSIWVDLTASNMVVVGPFLQGLSCVDQLETAQAKEMNISVDSPAFDSYRAVSAILLDIYEDAWNRSFTAANRTGQLDQLYALGSYLSTSSNGTTVPASFGQVQNNTFDVSFFSDYNRNGDLDKFLA